MATWGPTYAEMRRPARLPVSFRRLALVASQQSPDDPINLFNITWRLADGSVNGFQVPPALTGVAANILVMSGQHFPTASLEVGPAYCRALERQIAGRPSTDEIARPGDAAAGRSAAWVRARMGHDPSVRAPNDPMPAYRFHTAVTAPAAAEFAAAFGLGRVDAFVCDLAASAAMGAGDVLKASQGATVMGLSDARLGPWAAPYDPQSLDGLMEVDDEAALRILEMVQHGADLWCAAVDADSTEGRGLVGRFGLAGARNLLGAIRIARHLSLGPGQNVVTVSPSGFEPRALALRPPVDRTRVDCALAELSEPPGDSYQGVTAEVRAWCRRERALAWGETASEPDWATERAEVDALDRALLAVRPPLGT